MEQIISQVVKQLFDQDISVQLTRPDPKFGDFATNVALQLAKPLGKNPREIAEMIAENLRKEEDFSEVSVAGPGFYQCKTEWSIRSKFFEKRANDETRRSDGCNWNQLSESI